MEELQKLPISGHTDIYCLIGDPVAHSISPAMHNLSFKTNGIDARYVAFQVRSEHLEEAVQGMRYLGIRGWNITMPHKCRMAELCDRLEMAGEIAGAVNTVKNVDGVLTGTTTDGTGWVESARDSGHDPTGRRIVQLGAGGAGGAILVQAAIDGAKHIDVFKRVNAKSADAQRMVDQLNEKTSCEVELHDLRDLRTLRACLADADILLNTTLIGMSGTPGCLIPDDSFFHEGLAVSDIIYEPRETELLRRAKAAGCETFNGMYMLLYQGAASFRIWTGTDMPVDAVKKAVFS